MSYSRIVFRAEEGVALITVNRPEKLNALNREVIGELNDAFEEVAADASVHGLIVTGVGEKAFVAGADIQELAALSAVEAQALALHGQAVFRRLEMCGKPSVAAVNGFALGGGLELALACTLRVASPNAKLGQPEVKLGLIPGYGGTQRLPRLVGRGRALEMLLTGEPVAAEEAWRIGLVNHVVAQPDLMEFSRGLLKKICENAPVAVRLAMEAVDAGFESGLEQGLRSEASAFAIAAATEDFKEGTRAFLEKRKAGFAGK